MLYLPGITASSSPDLHLELERDDASPAAGCRPAGARDFLASLNQGQGRELLDAFIENRNDERRNALAMHYGLCAQVAARLVYRALTPESRRQVEIADVEQTAMVLLFQLVEKFDCSLGIPLSAFLTRRLRYALIDEFRRLGLMVRGGRVEGERLRRVPMEGGERVLVVVDRGRSPVELVMNREGRVAMLRRVPREYRLFVFYRYVRGMQLWQVAKKLNVTCERAGGIQGECLAVLGKEFGRAGGGNVERPTLNVQRPTRECPARPFDKLGAGGAVKQTLGTGGVLPVDLRRAKEFRRWFLLRVPWAYRKLVAYRYLRGRDIDWTAAKLGICPNKARVLDRQARPMMARVVEEYRGGSAVIEVA